MGGLGPCADPKLQDAARDLGDSVVRIRVYGVLGLRMLWTFFVKAYRHSLAAKAFEQRSRIS